jgi:hypothetical protein
LVDTANTSNTQQQQHQKKKKTNDMKRNKGGNCKNQNWKNCGMRMNPTGVSCGIWAVNSGRPQRPRAPPLTWNTSMPKPSTNWINGMHPNKFALELQKHKPNKKLDTSWRCLAEANNQVLEQRLEQLECLNTMEMEAMDTFQANLQECNHAATGAAAAAKCDAIQMNVEYCLAPRIHVQDGGSR